MLLRRGRKELPERAPQSAVAPPFALADTLSIAVLVASIVGSWFAFGRSDLSLDEGYTSAETRLPLRTLVQVLWSRELNGSLHTLLMWSLDEPGPALLRIASTVFMVGALVLLHRLVRQHYGPWPAFVALVVAGANPAVQQDMVVGRTYALSMLLVVLSIVLLNVAVREGGAGRFLVWGSLSGITLYAHFLTGLVLATQILWLVCLRRPGWREWATGVFASCFVSVPIGLFFLSGGGLRGQLGALPSRSVTDLLSGLIDVIAGYARAGAAAEVAVVLLVIGLMALGLSRNRQGLALLAVMTFLVPAVMLAIGAQFASSLFFEKYLVFQIPGMAIGVGAGIHRCMDLSNRLTLIATTLLTGLTVAVGVVSVGSLTGVPWTVTHPLTAAMRTVGAGRQVTTVAPFEGYLVRLYAERAGTDFVPGTPPTAALFLEQSLYEDRQCAAIPRPSGPIWIASIMSLHFDSDYRRLANCWDYRPMSVSNYGPVRVVELVPTGRTPSNSLPR